MPNSFLYTSVFAAGKEEVGLTGHNGTIALFVALAVVAGTVFSIAAGNGAGGSYVDSDFDGVSDAVDKCPFTFGTFCAGCPPLPCNPTCQELLCTESGPACVNLPEGVECGFEDCSVLDNGCRSYENAERWCSNGVCGKGVCNAYVKAPVGTPCVTRKGFAGACDEFGVCSSEEDRYLPIFDRDKDTILDEEDNCVVLFNPRQQDFDEDGVGDVCDEDADGDGVLDREDRCWETRSGQVVDAFGCSCEQKTCSDRGPCTDVVCDASSAACVASIAAGRACFLGQGAGWGICGLDGVCHEADVEIESNESSNGSTGSCVEGEVVPCGLSVGECRQGTRVCLGGSFSACRGEKKPALVDVCFDGLDNDCDGVVDEGCGESLQCAASETCGNLVDDDCNGVIDDGCGCLEYEFCADNFDNDCDGLADCKDPDCASDADCGAPCPQGLRRCGDACVNIQEDGRNCGGCGVVCDPGSFCQDGFCVQERACSVACRRDSDCGAGEYCLRKGSCAATCEARVPINEDLHEELASLFREVVAAAELKTWVEEAGSQFVGVVKSRFAFPLYNVTVVIDGPEELVPGPQAIHGGVLTRRERPFEVVLPFFEGYGEVRVDPLLLDPRRVNHVVFFVKENKQVQEEVLASRAVALLGEYRLFLAREEERRGTRGTRLVFSLIPQKGRKLLDTYALVRLPPCVTQGLPGIVFEEGNVQAVRQPSLHSISFGDVSGRESASLYVPFLVSQSCIEQVQGVVVARRVVRRPWLFWVPPLAFAVFLVGLGVLETIRRRRQPPMLSEEEFKRLARRKGKRGEDVERAWRKYRNAYRNAR
ncbi:hypothetical protein D6783_04690 [Candidatus Woesearchaeota archaeon]|nr:MAG: hypothetical protein D6783_04690 [Candidatus Woesearchaeota archaeon]